MIEKYIPSFSPLAQMSKLVMIDHYKYHWFFKALFTAHLSSLSTAPLYCLKRNLDWKLKKFHRFLRYLGMFGIYFYFEIPPMKSCGKFPPNFCYKFSEQLFFQLPNILSKFGLSFLNKNRWKCHISLNFASISTFQKQEPLKIENDTSFYFGIFLLEKNWASYSVPPFFVQKP